MSAETAILATVTRVTTDGMEETQRQPVLISPVARDERIQAVDVLRGVAVLGILLMNISAFGLPMKAYINPSAAGGHTGLNLVYWFINQVLFEGKMRALFSMLFGAGVVLLTKRAEERGGGLRVADIYYRRTLWLILFGLLHAYFIWWGDILYFYGVAGLMLFPLRRARPRALLAAGFALLLIVTGKYCWNTYDDLKLRNEAAAVDRELAAGKQVSDDQKETKKRWEEKLKRLKPDQVAMVKEIEAHRGSYAKLFTWRAASVADGQSGDFYRYTFFDVVGMMLIGMALMMLGVLTATLPARTYTMMILFGYGVGGTINAFTGWHWAVKNNFDPIEGRMAFAAAYDVGRLSVALAHIGLVMLLVKKGWLRWLTSRLAAVGQSALSCYLATSVICTTIFYGYGLGLFARLQRYQLLYVVLGVWLFLLVAARVWLRRFRFGPMEWVWRSLTHWQKQPMRMRPGAVVRADPTASPAALS